MGYCNPLEERLVGLLQSRIHPLSGPELAAYLATTDRQVRAMINHLRKDHHLPVCSSPSEGFYWPRRRSGADHTLAQLTSRRNDLDLVIAGILEGLDNEFGAPRLFDLDEIEEAV